MKAADIPDEAFLLAVDEAIRLQGWGPALRWNVGAVLAGYPEHVESQQIALTYPNMPAKVVLAKAKRLILRGILDGCWCGCRGDWEIKTRDALHVF